jgi:hypothetical protein
MASALNNQRLPLVGYANVSAQNRPTFDHPNNVAFRSQAPADEDAPPGQLDAAAQSIMDQLPSRKVGRGRGRGRPRGGGRGREPAPDGRRRRQDDADEVVDRRPKRRRRADPAPQDGSGSRPGDVAEHSGRGGQRRGGRQEKHDVHAVFGEEEEGDDNKVKNVWLFVKSAPKRGQSGKERVQFLAPADTPGLWVVLGEVDENKALLRKSWKGVVFNVKGTGRNKKLTTAVPFPARDLTLLGKQCKNHDLEDSDSASDQDSSYSP